MPSPQILPCPAGHTHQHLGTYLDVLHRAFWDAHRSCEPKPETTEDER
jgi:hypothetical protein